MELIKTDGQTLRCGGRQILLRGFGLGGWLLPEGYMWGLYGPCDRPRRMEQLIEELCGVEYAEYFWRCYFKGYITQNDIKLIADEGFNSVRLPLNSRKLYNMENGQVCLDETGISNVDNLIQWCKEYGIYVILDMHGAPGGQTGTNIDDSDIDIPSLFIDPEKESQLIRLWTLLAERYADEPCIAGYDLLNEPLPEWFSQYNDRVWPLYQKLIHAIREVDKNHIIILEGVHWATDFSIFDDITLGEIDDNLMLEFHKYWSPPDKESLRYFIEHARKQNVPLFMGEGGENNEDWYTALFPLYEKLDISWSFWSYKKISCSNSPVTFRTPEGWESLIEYIDDNSRSLIRRDAISIFDAFLEQITTPQINYSIFRSLRREAPISLCSEFFDEAHITTPRKSGAKFRMKEPVTILFKNGKTGIPDYRRYNGEAQPEEENLVIELNEGDQVSYDFLLRERSTVSINVLVKGNGNLSILYSDETRVSLCDIWETINAHQCILEKGRQRVTLICLKGSLTVDRINVDIISQ